MLESLRHTGCDCSIIVADNHSYDDTTAIARRFGCKVVSGGLPAEGRNQGARYADGSSVLFVDADVIVPSATLRAALTALARPNVVGVHARVRPLDASLFVRWCYLIMNGYIRLLNVAGISQGVGTFILVRRDAFLRVGGFREDIAIGEDTDFFRRLGRVGRVVYLTEHIIYTSARRFFVENSVWFAAKCVIWAILRLCGASASLFSYRWKSYSPDLVKNEPLGISQKQIIQQPCNDYQ